VGVANQQHVENKDKKEPQAAEAQELRKLIQPITKEEYNSHQQSCCI
jgi:hypothetical protein